MDSHFQDKEPSAEQLRRWREAIAAAWPYTDEDPEPFYFDWIPDPPRSDATWAMQMLKASGNWTEADERVACDPGKPPPRPLAELEAEHDTYIKELMKHATIL